VIRAELKRSKLSTSPDKNLVHTCQGRVSFCSWRLLTTSMQLRRDESLSGTQDSTRTGLTVDDHSSLTIANSSTCPTVTVHNSRQSWSSIS